MGSLNQDELPHLPVANRRVHLSVSARLAPEKKRREERADVLSSTLTHKCPADVLTFCLGFIRAEKKDGTDGVPESRLVPDAAFTWSSNDKAEMIERGLKLGSGLKDAGLRWLSFEAEGVSLCVE